MCIRDRISAAWKILVPRKHAIRRIALSNSLSDARRPVHIVRVRVKRVGIHHDTQIEIEPKVAHLNGRARR